MNLKPTIVFLILFISMSVRVNSVLTNYVNKTEMKSIRVQRLNKGSDNILQSQHTGHGLDLSVRNFFDTVYHYFNYSFGYLLGTFEKYMTKSKSTTGKRVSYKGYQVLRIEALNEEQVESLKQLPEEIEGTEFWSPPVENYFSDLLVSPDSISDVREYLKENNIDYETLIRDLQKVISFENPKMNKEQRDLLIGKRGHPMTWMRYHRYSDMVRYMEFLAFSYPQIVELITIGYSTERLPLKVIKVFSKDYKNDEEEEKKPSFWIDGGMHGREWITSSVVLYIIKQFVEHYPKHKETVDSAVWYFMPVANPDGYEYSHSTDRLWRKTRSKHASYFDFIQRFLFGSCKGVDLNRNFDFHWGEKGVSEDPCREKYAGPKPFSEPETKAISSFIMNRKEKIKMYLTLHSYSQMWLLPWSYTFKKTSDYDEMAKMAKKATQAIALVTGSHYDVGSSALLSHPVSGTSEDWAKGVAGIKYSYAVRLRDRGSFGFLLPAAQIVPTAKEMFVAIKVLAKMISRKNNNFYKK